MALSKATANHFDDRNNLKFRGIKMVAIIRESYAPTGDNGIFPNFHTLFSLEQGSKEELSTYMARVRTINGKLKADGVELLWILLNMFTVRGLGGSYAAAKREFALTSSLFSALDIEGIKTRCSNYTSALTAMGDDMDDTSASAAGRVAAAPSEPSPPPTTGQNKSVFPPAKPPPGHKITAIMEKAATECPLWHNKRHGLDKFGYAFRAGFVCTHNLE